MIGSLDSWIHHDFERAVGWDDKSATNNTARLSNTVCVGIESEMGDGTHELGGANGDKDITRGTDNQPNLRDRLIITGLATGHAPIAWMDQNAILTTAPSVSKTPKFGSVLLCSVYMHQL